MISSTLIHFEANKLTLFKPKPSDTLLTNISTGPSADYEMFAILTGNMLTQSALGDI